jgi:hypothetical protein
VSTDVASALAERHLDHESRHERFGDVRHEVARIE